VSRALVAGRTRQPARVRRPARGSGESAAARELADAGRRLAAAAAGTGTVAGHLAGALTELFGSVAVAIVSLIMFRDELRARLRASTPAGIPLLTEAAAMIAAYLAAERDLGRIAADADLGTLAPMLLGSGHLAFADRTGAPPDPETLTALVTAVIAGVLR
jgi:hypothetical protein